MNHPIGPTQPTIGRIVHIATPLLDAIPAIITGIISSDGTIMATAFPPGCPPAPVECEHVEPTPGIQPAAGTWHWPPIR